MSHEPTSDLDWQAFLYVSGEMSPAEVESFEEQLGVDQAAREAVAQAVEMLEALSAVSPATIAVAPRHSNRRWPIFAALAAAAALVLFCVSLARRQTDGGDPTSELVSLWSDSSGPASDSMDADPGAVPMNEEDEELIVPGWLLAAVESASDDTVEED